MKMISYVGDHKYIRPEFLRFLADKGYECMCFGTISDALPLLQAEELHMLLLQIPDQVDMVAFQEQIAFLNQLTTGSVPIVLMTKEDTLMQRKAFMAKSYVRFMQYHEVLGIASANFERLERELDTSMQMANLRFAVLDDDKLQLHGIKELFNRHGLHNVSCFSHPRDFKASGMDYDVYLIDLILPETSGEEIIFQLRNEQPDATILAISAMDEKEVIANVLYLGADDFIVKPYNDTILMAKLHGSARMLTLLRENLRKTEELQELSIRDPMTELFNHRHLHDVMYQLTSKAVLEDRIYSVIMMDIDHFKTINDTFGHQFGDQVLMKIADTLRSTVRDQDIVGRYGGEEFIIILPDADAAQAYFVAERIRRNVNNQPIVNDVTITVSGGVAQFDRTSGESVVEMADRELYRAKRNGRNRIEWINTKEEEPKADLA